jgi:arsenite-transporting ATPase
VAYHEGPNREQARYLELIRREMGNYVVGYIRQYPSEIRGLEALNLALQELGRWSPA